MRGEDTTGTGNMGTGQADLLVTTGKYRTKGYSDSNSDQFILGRDNTEICLLLRLQVQTSPNQTCTNPQNTSIWINIDKKIVGALFWSRCNSTNRRHQFSKIAVTFEQMMQFLYSLIPVKPVLHSLIYEWKHHIKPLGMAAP